MSRKEERRERVILVGRYPPPFGGVSVHVYRLRELLLAKGIKSTVLAVLSTPRTSEDILSIRAIHKWLWVLIRYKCAVHIHVSTLDLRNAVSITAASLLAELTRNKLLLTVHGTAGIEVNRLDPLRNLVLRTALVGVYHYIAVGAPVEQNLLKLHIDAEKMSIIPGFFPPVPRMEDSEEIPQNIRDFMRNRTPVLTANAYAIDFHNGEDLYGVDLCVDLCSNLRQAYPQLGFIFCISNVAHDDYLSRLQNKIAASNLQDNFLFVTHSYNFYVFLMQSDLFVRPTNTDGDAISVREALYFKVPTIASDVVPRPQGVILFKSRDIDDLTAKVHDALDNYSSYKAELKSLEPQRNFEKILNIYSRIFGDKWRRQIGI
jgi:glycosyltransferase involved in cell wall biosynthesis